MIITFYLVNLKNIHAFSQVMTPVSPDSSTQHGSEEPVMLSKNFSSAANALSAAGTCIPSVVASSNELARMTCQQMCNKINSQGRVSKVILYLMLKSMIFIFINMKTCSCCAGASLKKRDSDCHRESDKVKRKAVVVGNVLDSNPCLEAEVYLSVILRSTFKLYTSISLRTVAVNIIELCHLDINLQIIYSHISFLCCSLQLILVNCWKINGP